MLRLFMKLIFALALTLSLASCQGVKGLQFNIGVSTQIPATDGHPVDINASLSLPAWSSAKAAKVVQPVLIPAP